MSNEKVIDAEIVSEEKIPERPRASPSLAQSASKTASAVADGLEAIGASDAASKVRVGVALGHAAGDTIEALKPAGRAIKDFGKKLEEAGLLKMAPRRRSFSPRKKVT